MQFYRIPPPGPRRRYSADLSNLSQDRKIFWRFDVGGGEDLSDRQCQKCCPQDESGQPLPPVGGNPLRPIRLWRAARKLVHARVVIDRQIDGGRERGCGEQGCYGF